MKLMEMIERIRREAIDLSGGTVDPRLENSNVIIEIILPRVFDIITKNASKDPDNLNALRKDHTISFSNGIGAFPESIKEEYANAIYVKEVPSASYQPQYADLFLNPRSRLVSQFAIGSDGSNRSIFFRWEAPTISTQTFAAAIDIDYGTNIITIAAHPYVTGQTAVITGVTGVMTGVTESQTVYIIVLSSTTIALAETLQEALIGTKIDLVAVAPGTATLTDSNTEFTGTLTLNAITTPILPTDYEDEVELKGNLLEEAIALAANIVSGKVKIPGLDYPELVNG